jgi:hypothetical protein
MKNAIRRIRNQSCKCLACLFVIFLFISNAVYAGNLFDKALQVFSGPGESEGPGGLTTNEIGAAFKDALRIGSNNVVSRLGQEGGFNADPAVYIPLPREFEIVKTTLNKIGMSFMVEELELKLNRAAEQATPKAKELFLQAIQEMTFEDVMNIYNGPEDSATQYFQGKMSESLATEMKPIINNSLSQVGAVKTYDDVISKYKSVPFVPDVKANLTSYVTQKGMDGIFHYMAKEEAAIREDPARQTTALLKRVFGAK